MPPRRRAALPHSRSETLERTEVASFDAAGTVRTADGREIAFQLSLSMARFERETRSVSLQAGVAKRPAGGQLGADAASPAQPAFSVSDLQGNGQAVGHAAAGPGSGFLRWMPSMAGASPGSSALRAGQR